MVIGLLKLITKSFGYTLSRIETPLDPPSSESTVESEEKLDPKYPIYHQHYLYLAKEQSDSQNEHDRAIINISSASLAASIAIIKPMSDLFGPVVDVGWVFASWFGFCIAISSVIESYQRSVDEYDVELEKCYPLIMNGDVDRKDVSDQAPAPKRSLRIQISATSLNTIARYSFYFGIASLLIFVGINILEGGSHLNKPMAQTTKSAQPSAGPYVPSNTVPFGKTPPAGPVPPVSTPKPASGNKSQGKP
jgi:thiol-disulfide isomerase/thioredoxin